MTAPTKRNRDLVLRSRRQLTLPPEVCEALNIDTGDRLEWSLTDEGLMVRPRRRAALEALRAIRQAFAESGITEEELLREGEIVREQLVRERYGGK